MGSSDIRKMYFNKQRRLSKECNLKNMRHSRIILKSVESGTLSKNQYESFRRVMARGTKVVNKVWYRSVSGLPVTRKTAGHRMGKGVGSFDSLCFPIPKGFIMFEIVEKEEIGPDVYRLLRAASKKLSIKTVVVIRGTNNLSLIKG